MKRCLTCHAIYDDKQETCEKDGAQLLTIPGFTQTRQGLGGKNVSKKIGVIGVAAAIVIVVSAFGIYYIFNRQFVPPIPDEVVSPSAQTVGEIQQPLGDVAPQLSNKPAINPTTNKPGYFLIGLSSREQADATQEMERRNETGYQTQVINSSEWSDLSPGYYVVVYGVLENMAEATGAANKLRARQVQVYVKYSGAPKSGGVITTPEKKTDLLDASSHNVVNRAQEEAASRQNGDAAEEAISEVKKLWEQHFTRCEDSYVSLDPSNRLRELKGVTFAITERRRLTKEDETRGFEWAGKVMAKWNVWRRGAKNSAWEKWRESPQGYSFDVSKRNSHWQVLNVLYDQKKSDCPDIAQ